MSGIDAFPSTYKTRPICEFWGVLWAAGFTSLRTENLDNLNTPETLLSQQELSGWLSNKLAFTALARRPLQTHWLFGCLLAALITVVSQCLCICCGFCLDWSHHPRTATALHSNSFRTGCRPHCTPFNLSCLTFRWSSCTFKADLAHTNLFGNMMTCEIRDPGLLQ